ncbi:MAG: nuclear transport factor 2 family protein [Actinobacteria bacterium]|nr:nuclear transport factor 2 family protein [Actinomycetota bacterium]
MTELERLIAVDELQRLKALYCRYADAKAWPELGQLFTPNGEARFYDPGGRLVFAASSPDIGTAVGDRIGAAQPIHHIFSNELTVWSPTEAEGLWAMEDLVVFPDGVPGPFRKMHGFGHYHETYERHGGRWLIRSLALTRLRIEIE